MTLSRNRALARSILFGTLTKLGGALVALLGLPIIARSLDVANYADFLRAISLASALTMLVGAAHVVSVRDLSTALAKHDPQNLRETESSTFALYLCVALAGCFIATGLISSGLSGEPNRTLLVTVSVCVLVQGLLQWAEAYRVALRADHITSIYQLTSAIVMFALLVALREFGIWVISAIYFGVPLLTQAAIAAQLCRSHKPRLKPQITLRWFRGRIATVTPVLTNSAIEYAKIFGSGLALSRVSGEAAYAQHLTLLLLAARLVNPISLVTRPLMPAYIDAVHANDDRWLSRLRAGLALTLVSTLAVSLLLGITVRPDLLHMVLPSEASNVSRVAFVGLLLFLWGHGSTTLLSPLFFAASRGKSLVWVNGSLVAAGILVGTLASHGNGASTMLVALGSATAATGAWALWFACRHLLSISSELGSPLTGTSSIRPQADLVKDT